MNSSASSYAIKRIGCPGCLRPTNPHLPHLAMDRGGRSARSAFVRAAKIEREYTRRLRAVARHVSELLRGFAAADIAAASALRSALEHYARTLIPWAEKVGARMVAEVAARDERAWMRTANAMGAALRQEIATAPTGAVMRERQAEQVRLIKSLPLEAAERVHEVAREGIAKGWRADRVADAIMEGGNVTRSRAELIARTEVGRTSTLLTQARAEHVGSTGYIWRTADDSDVRASHREMAGKFVPWDKPPTLDNMTGHAGTLPNCRCYCEPVIPE